jgi:hypothetical protein
VWGGSDPGCGQADNSQPSDVLPARPLRTCVVLSAQQAEVSGTLPNVSRSPYRLIHTRDGSTPWPPRDSGSSQPRDAEAGQAARTISDAAERTTRAGAESFQRNADTAREAWRSGAEAAGRITQRSVEQWSKMFGLSGATLRETLQQSSGNMQAVMESTTVVAGSFQDVTGEWMRFAERRAEQNLDHLDRLSQCRNLQDYWALQTRMVRDNMEAFLQSAQRTSERTTQMARTAVERISSLPTPSKFMTYYQ